MSKIIKKISCDNYSFGIGENGEFIIGLCGEPIYGEISLYHMTYKEAENIAKMLLDWVELKKAEDKFNK